MEVVTSEFHCHHMRLNLNQFVSIIQVAKSYKKQQYLKSLYKPDIGSAVKVTQPSRSGLGPSVMHSVNNLVKSSFELLHGVIFYDIHLERVTLSVVLIREEIAARITIGLLYFEFIATMSSLLKRLGHRVQYRSYLIYCEFFFTLQV